MLVYYHLDVECAWQDYIDHLRYIQWRTSPTKWHFCFNVHLYIHICEHIDYNFVIILSLFYALLTETIVLVRVVKNILHDILKYIFDYTITFLSLFLYRPQDSKVHGANIWGPSGTDSTQVRPHVGPMNLAIRADWRKLWQGPLLLTGMNFNPNMGKRLHQSYSVGWNYLSATKFKYWKYFSHTLLSLRLLPYRD